MKKRWRLSLGALFAILLGRCSSYRLCGCRSGKLVFASVHAPCPKIAATVTWSLAMATTHRGKTRLVPICLSETLGAAGNRSDKTHDENRMSIRQVFYSAETGDQIN